MSTATEPVGDCHTIMPNNKRQASAVNLLAASVVAEASVISLAGGIELGRQDCRGRSARWLQNERRALSVDDKAHFVVQFFEAGLKEIEQAALFILRPFRRWPPRTP